VWHSHPCSFRRSPPQTRGAAAWGINTCSKRAGDHTRTASSGQGLEIAASVPCRTKRTELGQSVPSSDLHVRPCAKLAILLLVLLEGADLIAG